ncbi:MAG TPA: hypothetical protein VGA48_07180 [Thermoplasmata archaeon]
MGLDLFFLRSDGSFADMKQLLLREEILRAGMDERFRVRSFLFQGASGLFEFSPLGWVDECVLRSRSGLRFGFRHGTGRGFGLGKRKGRLRPRDRIRRDRLSRGQGHVFLGQVEVFQLLEGRFGRGFGDGGFHRDLEQRRFNRG